MMSMPPKRSSASSTTAGERGALHGELPVRQPGIRSGARTSDYPVPSTLPPDRGSDSSAQMTFPWGV